MSKFKIASLIYRIKYGGGHKKQAIARAVGTSNNKLLTVIDATCGLGNDALILAHLNCHVHAIEADQTIAKLFQQKLSAISQEAYLTKIIKNINLYEGNCVELIPWLLETQKIIPDVIYLDPMFNLNSSALPNKEIQLLKKILAKSSKQLNSPSHSTAILKPIITYLKYLNKLQVNAKNNLNPKIVVKRSRTAAYLEGVKPSYQLLGKANRFDIYVNSIGSPD